MKSYFITGTDTDVGKTWITAGIASVLKKMGIDVGIMKPFAAGTAQKVGFKSEDTEILAKAAQINDEEQLINPQFFPIPASPYTASESLGVEVDVNCYSINELKRDLEKLTGISVLGVIPNIKKFDLETLRDSIEKEIDLQTLLN